MGDAPDPRVIASGWTSGQPVACVDATSIEHSATTMAEVRSQLTPLLARVRETWFQQLGGDATSIVAVLTRPAAVEADAGLLFVAAAGPLGGCGEATMFARSVCSRGAGSTVVVDTAGGQILAADSGDGEISLVMPPTSEHSHEYAMQLCGRRVCVRTLTVAGNVFAALPAAAVDLDLDVVPAEEITHHGNVLLAEVNAQLPPGVAEAGLLLLMTPVVEGSSRSAVVWDGILNRGPCGTGTAARLILAVEDGDLSEADELVHASPFGEVFRARLATDSGESAQQGLRVQLAGHVTVASAASA